MPLTVDERRLIARACRSLAHINEKDAQTQSWTGVKEAQLEEARKLMDIAERMERGLPPLT